MSPLILALMPAVTVLAAGENSVQKVVFAVHGGLGMPRQELSAEMETQYRAELDVALKAGFAVLQDEGRSGLDAVEAAIRLMEDSPLFNAGKGAVFTHDGRNELDASIMEGRSKMAGAVAGVTVVKNPISAARAVMEKSKHVMLIGRGAEIFAKEAGLEIVDPAYFRTDRRWKQLQDELQQEREAKKQSRTESHGRPHEWSTVGAVALDRHGNLAAGTSTGGMSNKRFGRVGDSPIIGAGTYADNQACAVSATGHGEYFIRFAVAHEIAALMKYKGLSVADAAHHVVQTTLKEAGGEGGIIALDRAGNLALSYNSEGMFRGYVTQDGDVHVMLYDK